MNIEPLEPRIAPASLTFTELDGDNVVITTSSGTLTSGMNVIVGGGQLQKLDLTDAAFQGANVSIVATRDPESGGDGRVNVGFINALGRDLGTVLVDGDLGRIEAGDPIAPARACKSLTVQSLGRLGLVTQGGAGDLVSDFDGRLGKLTVKGDVKDAGVGAGSIGSVFIGGSLIGGPNTDNGLIFSSGDMGLVKVGGDLVGGAGNVSGAIVSFGAIAGVTVGGSVLGGRNASTGDPELGSGAIVARGKLGPVKIGHDVRGDFGEFSGAIFSETQIVSVSIGGSLIGAGKLSSGSISTDGLCGPVTIKGDMVGGFGTISGAIVVDQDLASVTVGGSLIGGSGDNSGAIFSQGRIGPVKIGGNIAAGTSIFTGHIFGNTRITSLSIGGSVLGGSMESSGRIFSNGAIGPVKIGGDIRGGDGPRTGYIDAATTLGPVTVGGSLIGGDDMRDTANIVSGGAMGLVKIAGDIIAGKAGDSAQVDSGGTLAGITVGGSLVGDAIRHGASGAGNIAGQILSVGAMGPVKIGGDVIGGIVSQTGRIVSMDSIASVTIGGSLLGGNSGFTGEILSTGAMGPVKIGGDIRGNTGSAVGSQVRDSGYIEGQRIASLFVGGSIRAGVDAASGVPQKVGSVRAVDDIGPIVIKGSLLGSTSMDGDPADGDFTPAIISARGQAGLGFTAKNDVAIESIMIKRRVEQAQILAGYGTSLNSMNADAQIGAVVIGGDLIASSIVAGVEKGGLFFGTLDFKMAGPGVKDSLDANGAISKIASVTIKGSVFGTAATNDLPTFAIVAQRLGALTLGGTIIPLTPGASNDPIGLATKLGSTRGATTDGFDFHAFEV